MKPRPAGGRGDTGNAVFAGPHPNDSRIHRRCESGPIADAARLANQYVAVGEPPPSALVELLLADCSPQGVGR